MNDPLDTILTALECFGSCTSVEDLGQALMKQLNGQLGIQGSSLYLCGKEELTLAGEWGCRHAPARIPLPLRPNSPLERCFQSKQPLVLDAESWQGSVKASGWHGYSNPAALVVPLFNQSQEIIGLLSMHDHGAPAFEAQEVQLARVLAAIAAGTMRAIQSYQAVQDNEARLRTFVRHLPGMAYRCSDASDWHMEFLSEGCLALTGYAAEALTAPEEPNYADLIHPEDRPRLDGRMRTAVEQHTAFEVTYRIHTADGSEKWVWQKGAGSYDEQGKLLGIDGFITDVTAQRLSERQLSRIAMALDQASEAMLVTNLEGIILYANQTFERLSGHRIKDLGQTHRSILTIVTPEDHPALATLRRCEKDGRSCKVDLDCISRDGQPLSLQFHLAPLRDDDGVLRQFVYLISDVSAEHKLKAQLLQAQKMEAIGSLASGIAHEINTPTQYIGDNLRFIGESFDEIRPLLETVLNLDGEMAPVLQPLKEQAETADLGFLLDEIPNALRESSEGNRRVAEIVRAMKAFAHPDDEDFQDADLNEALEAAAAVARNEWKYVADLSLELDEDLPAVPCQLGALNQVFLNIIVNAAHAIRERLEAEKSKEKGRIIVRTGKADRWASIAISDTGAGIPEAVRSKIFDPFFTTKGVGKGTGQGLALSHTVVVDQHGGLIDVESQPGEGTTFTLRIPLERNYENAP